jgi:hypothetical protein
MVNIIFIIISSHNKQGMWPAHWLVSETACWPVGAEIDILESISKPESQMYLFIYDCNTLF